MSELQLPDAQTLTAGLTAALSGAGPAAEPVTVLGREPNSYASSFASEIVTCRRGAEELRLFCKYSAGGHGTTGYGLWGCVAYEAEVYLSGHSGAGSQRIYGIHTYAATGETML